MRPLYSPLQLYAQWCVCPLSQSDRRSPAQTARSSAPIYLKHSLTLSLLARTLGEPQCVENVSWEVCIEYIGVVSVVSQYNCVYYCDTYLVRTHALLSVVWTYNDTIALGIWAHWVHLGAPLRPLSRPRWILGTDLISRTGLGRPSDLKCRRGGTVSIGTLDPPLTQPRLKGMRLSFSLVRRSWSRSLMALKDTNIIGGWH
jgi:hypothetical protein